VPTKYQNSYAEHVPWKMQIKRTDDFKQCGIFRVITLAMLVLCVISEDKRQTQSNWKTYVFQIQLKYTFPLSFNGFWEI
jgi:hypothetical protein